MIFHENRLPADDSHVCHALFVIFEKAAKFKIVVCCKIVGGALLVNFWLYKWASTPDFGTAANAQTRSLICTDILESLLLSYIEHGCR